MADLLIDTQGPPAAPAAGKGLLYFDSVSKQLTYKNDTGRAYSAPGIKNYNTADVVASAANTYLTGSLLDVPPHLLQVGAIFKWRLFMTKTAAGVAAPVWTIVVGINGTTADTIRNTFTGTAQTAAVDTAFVEITAILRNIGAAGVLAGGLVLQKSAVTAAGFTNTVGGLVLINTSAGFDTTTPNLKVGVCVNPGASGVWTHQIVKSEVLNL